MVTREAPSRDVQLDELDALDAGNAFLDDLGDPRLDDVRRRTGIIHRHRDDGRVDVGILAQRQAVERHQPECNQQ